jgi:nitroreductase
MDLSEAIRRRRACRDFVRDPVPAELMERLVDAANRAPTASNVPYREIMIVDDPAVIRAVRLISPALIADPPALLVVLTDLRVAAERIGNMGAICSLVDSGAAGENVWLAAVDAGLATGFTMISAMAGIRVILGLPEHVRVDLIMPVGRPAAGAGKARVRLTPPAVHHNQYGRVHDAA